MYGIIDRIEGDIVIVEFDNDTLEKIAISKVKGDIQEGNALYKNGDFYIIDKTETDKRKKEAEELLDTWE